VSSIPQDVQDALQNLPSFARLTTEDYQVTRLGGLTNKVYRVDVSPHADMNSANSSASSGQSTLESVVVRLPGEGTEDYIDRQVEAHNAKEAARAGVSPAVLYVSDQSGVMITRCVPDIATMTSTLFSQRQGSPARAGSALRKLHRSNAAFKFRFELFAMIDDYLKLLDGKQIQMPDGYHDIVQQAEPVKIALQKNPVPLAPCHCDPLCENFLDDGSTMWIVDWEYSGMNDPYWDLGDLSVEGQFNEQQDQELMGAYCGGQPSDAEMARMIIYKAMCDLLWTLWGLIQHADGNPAEDFWAYSVDRFDRCKTLMNRPEFSSHIAALDSSS